MTCVGLAGRRGLLPVVGDAAADLHHEGSAGGARTQHQEVRGWVHAEHGSPGGPAGTGGGILMATSKLLAAQLRETVVE